jgi:hypothetical protein
MAHALKAPEVGFALDESRVAEDARFDGIPGRSQVLAEDGKRHERPTDCSIAPP